MRNDVMHFDWISSDFNVVLSWLEKEGQAKIRGVESLLGLCPFQGKLLVTEEAVKK